MSSIIRVLSEHTINQIAAGEVIENPASIVKELIENAIDAKASKIVIEVSGGGLQKICVSDDGTGMGSDDAILCLQRHATSKIRQAEDLSVISTMGFRGEALASIAAISKMTLLTSPASGLGTQVEVEAGVIKEVKPCARNQGTSIEVRQLFYNVPARRKFQKSPALCLADMIKMITQLSLAYPSIGFELYDSGEQRLRLIKKEGDFLQMLQERVKQVLGEDFLEEAFIVEAKEEPFTFRGILGSVQNTRPNRAQQYSFLNERSILCPTLSFAVKEAFGTRIAQDRFPIYVLHLDIPSSFIDVNVHPQKKEVRLREEGWIRKNLQETIQKQLFSKETAHPSLAFNLFSPESFLSRPEPDAVPRVFAEEQKLFFPLEAEQMPLFVEKQITPMGLYRHFLWIDASSTKHLSWPLPSEGIWIVDLKAASSRLLWESFLQEKEKEAQTLLLPLTFSCSIAEAEEISSHFEDLEKMGFYLRSSGKNSFFVEAIPSHLQQEEVLDFLRMVFLEDKKESWELRKERSLASACCRIFSLRRDGYLLSQALEIFTALTKIKAPLLCPLGNKTIISMEEHELQQLFVKRR
ncbi:MAG: DNA mismatch repair endonuclease MutL [Rhabdochlamydiaceae bacterium]|nr:DNA mismatch repair endonuclease MutL [Rhabdochlamydiaceae bacterium]